ncbi:von Willebrand factor type A domain-containing protein [Thecamonas trahens ATCC 50062]|uniref:von Willebrand factor type A domain-containing protein n=1 Tax=Thecamonas trahens ATCC 50062 TaxID=461836 RepID=A0A0L0DFA4_THETB|nr:von Willebrand factor type A domain-containing protein [Thecamonas trahens ATCC 50062]KNC50964.1 von Willebrand factor type A domain-containing protein [Thecamonas trahens ATCC 50062]|eukprot:XP_013756660.1 von Willebrand factor type A domain-containing protein [Thecamonas trahens ATCC 50062]
MDGGVNDATFSELMSNLTSTSSSFDRQDMVEKFVAANHPGFSGQQTAQLMTAFPNSLVAIDVLTAISSNVLDLTCDDAVDVLHVFSSELNSLDVLKVLSPMIVDKKANNATILATFSNTFNKRDALEILAATPDRNCIFGDVTNIPRIVFVVDTSGSMSTTFSYDHGSRSTSRMAAVRTALTEIITDVLTDEQQFNVVEFASSATAWQQGVVDVNTANIASAVSFVTNMSPGGSTAMLKGLQLAFDDPNCIGVYLLTDGEPNTSIDGIISAAKAWAGSDKSVNTIAFIAGASDPVAAQNMQRLAAAANGIYRVITG